MKEAKLYNIDIWIYNRIKFFHDKGMVFYECNETLSKLFNRHINRISASISKLIKLGYIENTGNKFTRQIRLTEKKLNINGVSFNKNSVILNNVSAEEISRMLNELNINGVENLTKAVLELNKNGVLYKSIYKIFNIDTNKDKKDKKDKNDIDTLDKFQEWVSKIPTLEEVNTYAIARGRTDITKKFHDWYTTANWKDNKGKQIKNWKLKFLAWEGKNSISIQTSSSNYKPSERSATIEDLYRIRGVK